jgi:hypothetical protein
MRRACREAFAEKDGVAFVARVMSGEVTETVAVTVGSGKDARTELVQVPAKIRDRLYAAELLMEHGHGKAPQELKIEDERPRRTGEETMARIMELLPRVIAVLPVDKKEIARLFAERRQIEVLVQGKVTDGKSGSGNGHAV